MIMHGGRDAATGAAVAPDAAFALTAFSVGVKLGPP